MLYDPKWNKPSALSMLLFCESKPADEAYNFMDSCRCACAQFSHSMGMVGAAWWSDYEGGHMDTWKELNLIARDHPRTFGALAARLRHLTTN